MIGQLNRKINIKSWGSIQDEGGGSSAVILSAYDLRAKVENRSGRQVTSEDQTLWSYDYKITVRYEKSRILKSNQTIDFDGKRLAINSISFEDEGTRRFCILRCSTVDESINTDNDLNATLKTFEYFGAGGESEFIVDGTPLPSPTITTDLRGKTVFRGFKDGVRFSKIESGEPVDKEFIFNSITGKFKWSVRFEPGERALIDYIG